MAGVARTSARSPVPIVALDFATVGEAIDLIDELGTLCGFYKIGSELFTATGPAAVAVVRERGGEVMLDLKFHDIPNTVAGAVTSARALGARIVTVHSTGGEEMLQAAVEAAGEACSVFAVTVLTSLDSRTVGVAWGRETVDVSREVVRLAGMAKAAGVAGVVSSGSEVAAIKAAQGKAFGVLVPGVRLAGSGAGDQRRVVTPGEASRLGADYVVLGRTVTAGGRRREAMERVLEELENPPG